MTPTSSSPSKIKSILIVNRGEIARRIIRTCKSLAIRTVVVYAPADSSAPYVREADTAVALPAPSDFRNRSLLLQIAKEEGVDAVHPGYGFLSENCDFVAQLENAGIIFIGPSSSSMLKLGNKSKAKEIALSVQVPIPPTMSLGAIAEGERTHAVADFGAKVGFPIMIKASSGGGGRGMRIVATPDAVPAELDAVSRESTRVFGSSEIFVEKYLSPARHVEVQIVGDTAGKVVALGTRDCSVQRSNQKIIEEAPAPSLPEDVLRALCDAAVRLGTAANYHCAGTVEFLVTNNHAFFLLEMNCRLQVEHPVTEYITGRDLVRDQIALAEGATLGSLGLSESPAIRGHSLEARICAEVTGEITYISTGVINSLSLPDQNGDPSIRCDFGFEAGDVVTADFDSLIGKIIVHAETREAALSKLKTALALTCITGVRTNLELVQAIISNDTFIQVNHSVSQSSQLFPTKQRQLTRAIEAAAIGAAMRAHYPAKRPSPFADFAGWSLGTPLRYPWKVCVNDLTLSTETSRDTDGRWQVLIDCSGIKNSFSVRCNTLRDKNSLAVETSVELVDQVYRVTLHRIPLTGDTAKAEHWVHLPHGTYHICEQLLTSGSTAKDTLAGEGEISSPLPGTITSIKAQPDQIVEEGEVLATLESMKMEHPIRAPFRARILEIRSTQNQQISAGTVIFVISRE